MKTQIRLASFLLTFIIISTAYGQYCPATGNCNFNVFIDDFTFNTISNLNSAGSNCNTTSYINTGLSTNVTKGLTYTLTVQCGPQYAQGVGIWIDYNQDYDFDDNGEFVWASPFASLITFIDSITIPQSALTGATRMRVRSIFNQVPTANQSCGSVTWGEIEDYTVVIQPNTSPPTADFTANATITCSGDVNFYDLSLNNPTGWDWDFGDLGTSSLQNPNHVYTNSGTFTVSLTATNNYGNDTKVIPNYITVNLGSGPVPANCYPTTTGWCCGFGITNVTFNTINNTTNDGSVGYEDYTCTQTSITAGIPTAISITADNPSEHNIRVWIDYNNDGSFNNTTELAFAADKVFVGSGNITAPSSAVPNTPLRMRISADYYLNATPTPCSNPQVGQVEDYTVVILPNLNLPVAAFTADTFSCSGTVQFTDLTQNAPTFWQWNFGDGNFSTFQNPIHTYTNSGTYTVKLIAYNNNGTDTVTYVDYIDIDLNAAPTATCPVNTLSYCCNYGIYNVSFESINNTTPNASEGYMDYSCTQVANVIIGNSYPIQISTGLDNPEDIWVWIDFDNNGNLDNTELVFNSLNAYNHTGNINIPSNAVLNTPLRMRVMSDYAGSNRNSCDDTQWGQTEDYAVIVQNSVPPVALFTSDSTVICMGTVNFIDLSNGNPTSWYWDFGDGNISTIQNPTHTYTNYGQYGVTLKVTNGIGTDSLYVTNYITYDSCNVGISEDGYINNILLYPNPVSNKLYITFKNKFYGQPCTIQLYNLTGQLLVTDIISKQGLMPYVLDMKDKNNGIYFISINRGFDKFMKRIILIKETN